MLKNSGFYTQAITHEESRPLDKKEKASWPLMLGWRRRFDLGREILARKESQVSLPLDEGVMNP